MYRNASDFCIFIGIVSCSILYDWKLFNFTECSLTTFCEVERLLLNHVKTPGFLALGGEEFNLGPEMRLDRSELLCNKVLLKYKGDRESF